ncbi:Piso0_001440 [Millerozyma farinosa CBS 7064]|uniref:Piso0_001440 protein n=1 Tax=Pichia sorbitophila (strain ATCC MYA-4447 / BCRC 22081 / CBS 7064 / NBRC 10061 / NRRL Y-12695) TaxID=559304 RepID=G8YN63_PICSO|nr:Piso0_001440 [Millerozyma farinosa CBS 7064]
MTNTHEESIAMFYDPEFNAVTYVNALLQSLSKPQYQTQTYSKDNLQVLSLKCSNLLTHLDFYTNELSRDLTEQLETLQNASDIVTQNIDASDSNNVKGINRLQYYVNSLNNSILMLQNDLQNVNNKITVNNIGHPKAVETLTTLKHAKSQVEKVIEIFENLNALAPKESLDSVTVESFQHGLTNLAGQIHAQLSTTTKEDLSLVLDGIDELINMLPVFEDLTNFYPAYKKFTKTLMNEKKPYDDKE